MILLIQFVSILYDLYSEVKMSREYVLHDGKRLCFMVRVTPRNRNEIAGVLNDGTIKVHLSGEVTEDKLNLELVAFIAEVLGALNPRRCSGR